MKCPLCGFEKREENSLALQGGGKACSGCPMRKSCKLQKCPNCGYEMPMEPKLIKFIRKLRRKSKNGT